MERALARRFGCCWPVSELASKEDYCLAGYGSYRVATEARGLLETGATRACVALPGHRPVSSRTLWSIPILGSPLGWLRILTISLGIIKELFGMLMDIYIYVCPATGFPAPALPRWGGALADNWRGPETL